MLSADSDTTLTLATVRLTIEDCAGALLAGGGGSRLSSRDPGGPTDAACRFEFSPKGDTVSAGGGRGGEGGAGGAGQ
jgi:hypothetical protein